MPSPRANLLARQFRRDATLVGFAVSRRIRQIARGADVADIDAWWARVSPTVERAVMLGHDATATLAARHLRAHAAIEGVAVDPLLVEASRGQIATSLHVTGPVAFKRQMAVSGAQLAALQVMAARLAGSTLRLTLAGGRGTTMRTVQRSPTIVGWRRVTASDPCPFCAMLASRGSVYKTRETAAGVVGREGRPRGTRQIGESFHDSCRCTVEPLYELEQEPPEVLELQERWARVTEGLSGKDALNAWRRALTAA